MLWNSIESFADECIVELTIYTNEFAVKHNATHFEHLVPGDGSLYTLNWWVKLRNH